VTAFINTRFLNQTKFDSAAPTGTAVVAHELKAGDSYELAVQRRDQVLNRVPMTVMPMPDAQAMAAATPGAERAEPVPRVPTSFDLSKLARTGRAAPEDTSVAVGGWVSFSSSQDMAGHHVMVRRMKDAQTRGETVFDSRRLDDRSVYALTLLQPGRYSLKNAIDGKKAEIVVSYPQVGDAPYRPPEPLQIQVTKEGFGSKRIQLSPAQGIIFRFQTKSRIEIELVEPDKGPRTKPTPRARFVKPAAPEQPPPQEPAG
jgi:hypothetical protein